MLASVKSELLKYGETTSVRGVPKFFKSKDYFLKFLWLVCVLACTAVLIYLLIVLFQKFYSWPVSTKYGEKIGKNIIFPDITVCNLDPFAEGVPKDLPFKTYRDFLISYEDLIVETMRNGTNYTDNSFLNRLIYEILFNQILSVPGYIINLPKNRPESIDCPGLIAECTYFTTDWFESEVQCSIESFTKRWNENYYTCYTLQTSKLIANSNTSNVIRGLSMVLNVGPPNLIQTPYKSSIVNSQARGVQVSVHSPGTPPDLKRGFNVAPGTENIVNIVQTERTRLDKPYNELGCTHQTTIPNSTADNYTHDLCLEYCQQEVIQRECGCMSSLIAVPIKNLDNVEICGNFSLLNASTDNATRLQEIINSAVKYNCSFSEFVDFDGCQQECLIPCTETLYDSYLTSASWPQPSVQLDIFKDYILYCTRNNPNVKSRYSAYLDYYNQIETGEDVEIPISNLTQIQESLLEVKFLIKQNFPYYQSDNPTYTWDVMIGTVGGMLSLWLGITVASGVELVELAYLLFKCCCCNKKKKTQEGNDIALGDNFTNGQEQAVSNGKMIGLRRTNLAGLDSTSSRLDDSDPSLASKTSESRLQNWRF